MTGNSSHEAAEVLRMIGRNVDPPSADRELWLVDVHECTDGELIALAHLFGLVSGPERAQ